MVIVIDIGSHQTLIGLFDDSNVLIKKINFKTPINYQQFLIRLEENIVKNSTITNSLTRGIIGISADFDINKNFIFTCLGLPWKNTLIVSDIEKITNCPLLLENNTLLAGLYESTINYPDQNKKILYLSIGNTIKHCLITNNKIKSDTKADRNNIIIEKSGKAVSWDKLISGRSIIERFSNLAKNIKDETIWKAYAQELAQGLWELNAVYQPDTIIIGGTIGQYFNEYKDFLNEELKKYILPIVPLPNIIRATKPFSNVLFGGNLFITQNY